MKEEIEQYMDITGNIERKLDEADKMAESTDERFSHESIFGHVRDVINGI